ADSGGVLPDFDVYGCTPIDPGAVCTKIQTVSGTNAGLTNIPATAFALPGADSYLFFGGQTFSRLDLVTGDVVPQPSGAARTVIQTAVADDQSVFWMDAIVNQDFSTGFSLWSDRFSFSNPNTVVQGQVGSSVVACMTADNAYLYFSSSD